ncbi:hypothetical protein D3C87_873180 [compost metagenome]
MPSLETAKGALVLTFTFAVKLVPLRVKVCAVELLPVFWLPKARVVGLALKTGVVVAAVAVRVKSSIAILGLEPVVPPEPLL